MKNTFQAIITGVFIFAIILSILVFSGFVPLPGKKTEQKFTGKVSVWGVFPESEMGGLIDVLNKTVKTYEITYTQKKNEEFINDLVNALASGTGPDIISFDPSMVINHGDKIYKIPYSSISQRTFLDTYADAATPFLSSEGILALPVSIDPMVLFYNKDLLGDQAVALPPVYWSDIIALNSKLSKVDEGGNLIRSMIALGEYDNISNATDIFNLMMLQLGNSLVTYTSTNDDGKINIDYKSTFNKDGDGGIVIATEVLKFYSAFSDPAKQTYSWNKNMPTDKNAFVAGKLAFYLGYSSEYSNIKSKNPNLNFDITRVPQAQNYPTKATMGNVYGFAILKTTKNIGAAFETLIYLTSKDYTISISRAFSLAPATRSLLSIKQEDPINEVIYPSALITKTWLNPDRKKVNELYRSMIQGVVSGKSSLNDTVSSVHQKLTEILN